MVPGIFSNIKVRTNLLSILDAKHSGVIVTISGRKEGQEEGGNFYDDVAGTVCQG